MILRTLGFSLFSSLRVYALMEGRWPLALFVFSMFLPSIIAPSFSYANQSSIGVDRFGCQFMSTSSQIVHDRLRIAGIIADLLSETIVIIVTLKRTFHLRGNIPKDEHDNKPGLAALLLRDGTVYFVALLVLSLADMLVLVFDHVPQPVVGYDYWVVPFYTPVFRTIIISRFILMLRAIHYNIDDGNEHYSTGLQFGSRVVGSLGAPVEPLRFVDGASADFDEEEDENIIFSNDPFAAGMLSTSSPPTSSATGSGSETKHSDEMEMYRVHDLVGEKSV
ncbi:hypothetical protein CPB83DRAFT_447713 [Crepidotus variabilis]|uniref:Uncharacterized protein n=1 Tax=Crepidotus variabilis TaxID=179855 RepID=A0A9P6JNM1_9AGAR|nr:hypothetical protein CPB83DRAFT_447713 [Crepidotus variabilis]